MNTAGWIALLALLSTILSGCSSERTHPASVPVPVPMVSPLSPLSDDVEPGLPRLPIEKVTLHRSKSRSGKIALSLTWMPVTGESRQAILEGTPRVGSESLFLPLGTPESEFSSAEKFSVFGIARCEESSCDRLIVNFRVRGEEGSPLLQEAEIEILSDAVELDLPIEIVNQDAARMIPAGEHRLIQKVAADLAVDARARRSRLSWIRVDGGAREFVQLETELPGKRVWLSAEIGSPDRKLTIGRMEQGAFTRTESESIEAEVTRGGRGELRIQLIGASEDLFLKRIDVRRRSPDASGSARP